MTPEEANKILNSGGTVTMDQYREAFPEKFEKEEEVLQD